MLSTAIERLPAFQDRKQRLVELLYRLAAFADSYDPDRAAAIRQAAADLNALIFNVAVIGEFNRGKTTLINALLGRPGLLTTAPIPNTAALTRLLALDPEAAGSAEHFRVVFRDPARAAFVSDDLAQLAAFSSDAAGQPSDVASIDHIDLFLDSDFLRRSGMVLIDTPGLGALSQAHQDITERLIPTVHAALFVFMVDPPPGATELAFLRFSQRYISRFLFVLNDKQQLLRQSPAEAEAVLAYARRLLSAAGIDSPPVTGLNPGAFLRGMADDDGGFGAFLPLLADFLIAGQGRALLWDALHKAEQHGAALDTRLLRQIDDTARDNDQLRAALARLSVQTAALDNRRLGLLARVDNELGALTDQLVAEIDSLQQQIERTASETIDRATIGALRTIPTGLSEAIQTAVSGWLRDKSTWLNGRASALYQQIVDDLCDLVADYQAADLSAVTISRFDLPRGIEVALSGDVALALATGLGIAASVALLDVATTGGIGALSLLVGGAAGSGTAGALLLQRVRTSLKQALKQPLPAPNENRTALSALIDGYWNDAGDAVPGLRERLIAEFDSLDSEIKSQINATIADAWQPRLTELQTELERRAVNASTLETRRQQLETARQQLAMLRQDFTTAAETLADL